MNESKTKALEKKKDSYPGWRTMSGAVRHNAKKSKIMDHYREHVEKFKTENPAEHEHLTKHLMNKRYEGCKYGNCAK